MTTTIYGIKACDTMKKARTWLDEQGIDTGQRLHWQALARQTGLLDLRGRPVRGFGVLRAFVLSRGSGLPD